MDKTRTTKNKTQQFLITINKFISLISPKNITKLNLIIIIQAILPYINLSRIK